MWIGFVFDECVGDGYGGSGGAMDFTRLCLGLVSETVVAGGRSGGGALAFVVDWVEFCSMIL